MGTINLQVTGAVARVVISAPDRHNAMSFGMWTRLREVVESIAGDACVRVVLLRGDGDRAFVSGADISEFATQHADASGVGSYDRAVSDAQDALTRCPVPVVASIRGVCMGGGLGLALACDLRYAAATARFRMPAARLGVGYGLDGIRHFVDVIGAARTAELFCTARTFDGIEAARIGVVHAVHEDHRHDAAVEEILAAIAENAPLTLRAAKRAIETALRPPPGGDGTDIAQLVAECMASADYVEGCRAFAEKRAPRFVGR